VFHNALREKLVKQFIQPRLAFVVAMTRMVFVVIWVLKILTLLRLWVMLLRRDSLLLGWCFHHASFDYFVYFSAIKPHATALGAVIDLDTLTVGHD
jgi:hypothetical protein